MAFDCWIGQDWPTFIAPALVRREFYLRATRPSAQINERCLSQPRSSRFAERRCRKRHRAPFSSAAAGAAKRRWSAAAAAAAMGACSIWIFRCWSWSCKDICEPGCEAAPEACRSTCWRKKRKCGGTCLSLCGRQQGACSDGRKGAKPVRGTLYKLLEVQERDASVLMARAHLDAGQQMLFCMQYVVRMYPNPQSQHSVALIILMDYPNSLNFLP